MSTWLKLLPLDLQGIDQLQEPTDDVKEGENVIGVISDDLRRLWTMYRSMDRAAKMLSVECQFRKASDEDRGKVSELVNKARVLYLLFWIGVQDELELWSHRDQCDIRSEWRVVEYRMPQPPPGLIFPFGNQP